MQGPAVLISKLKDFMAIIFMEAKSQMEFE